VRFAVVHEYGDARGRDARCAAPVPAMSDVLVFGHSTSRGTPGIGGLGC
jgi:hypothetical protein